MSAIDKLLSSTTGSSSPGQTRPQQSNKGVDALLANLQNNNTPTALEDRYTQLRRAGYSPQQIESQYGISRSASQPSREEEIYKSLTAGMQQNQQPNQVRKDENGYNTNDQRDALLGQLRNFQSQRYLFADPDAQVEYARQVKEYTDQLDTIDAQLGNPAQYYDSSQRGAAVGSNWAKNFAGSNLEAVGTLGEFGREGDLRQVVENARSVPLPEDAAGMLGLGAANGGIVQAPTRTLFDLPAHLANAFEVSSEGAETMLGYGDGRSWEEIGGPIVAPPTDPNQPKNWLQMTEAERSAAMRSKGGQWLDEAAEGRAKEREGLNKAQSFGLDIVEGGMDLAADQAANLIVPGMGMVEMGVRTFGSAAHEVAKNGGDINQQFTAGAKAAAIEIMTEKISEIGGVHSASGKGWIDGWVDNMIDKAAKHGQLAAFAANVSAAFGSEFLEEAISGVLNPIADYALNLSDNVDIDWGQVFYEGLIGGVLGIFGGVQKGVQYNAQQRAQIWREAVEEQFRNRFMEEYSDGTEQTETQKETPQPKTGQDALLETIANGQRPQPTAQDALLEAAGITQNQQAAETPQNAQGVAGDIPASQTGTESGTAAPVELNTQDGQTSRREALTEPADPATMNSQERIRWAIELRKAGAEPGEIFNKTNLIFNGNGDIQDGFGGKVVGRFDNGQKNMGELDSDFPVDAQKAPGDAQERVPGNEPRGVRTDGQRAYDIPAGEDKHRVILHDDLIARLPDGQLDKLYTYAVDIGDEVLLRQVDDEIRRRHNPVSGKIGASGRVYSPSEIERLRGISDNVLDDAYIRILNTGIDFDDELSLDRIAIEDELARRASEDEYYGNIYGLWHMIVDGASQKESEADNASSGSKIPSQTQSEEDSRQAPPDMIERGKAQPSGVTANGPVLERGFAENIRTSGTTEADLARSLEAEREIYKQLANKDVLAKADELFGKGLDEARAAVDRAIANSQSGMKMPPEMIPLARMVANELTRNGDTAAARRIISDLAVELTEAGQLSQVGKLLRNTDPQTAMQSIQKALDTVNKKIADKYGKRYNWRAELTEAEIDQINNTDFTEDGAYEEIYEQIAERLGKEMPSTLWDKITEIRRINMLLRPKTQIKNFLSNFPMVAMRKGAETLSGAIQDKLVKSGVISQDQQTRTAKVTKETKRAAKDYFENHKETILGEGNKWDMNTLLNKHRTFFKDGALAKAISKKTGKEAHNFVESARKLTYDLLKKGDAPFVKSAYIDNLAQYCSAHGITDISQAPQEAFDFAMANAMEATFKAANKWADAVNKIKQKGGIAGAATDVLLPFTTTPANIFDLTMKYSPIGFANALAQKYKGADISTVVDTASKATVGSLIYAVGFLARALGGITGKADDDKDKAAFDKANGISPYSIGGRWSYDWIQPVGSLMALGAETYDSIQGDEKLSDVVFDAIFSAGDSLLNMSLFQNITSVLKGQGSSTENIINAIADGYATQMVPGLVGDIAKLVDDTVRSTYTGGNVLETAAAKDQAMIPFASKNLPASMNVKGEKNTRGGTAWRIFDVLLNPGVSNHVKMDETSKAIYDLYDLTGDKTIFPSVSPSKVDKDGTTYKMNGSERSHFQELQGQTYMQAVEAMKDSKLWGGMTEEAKVQALQDLNSYSLDSAKRDLVERRGAAYSSDWDDEHALSDIPGYLAAKATMKTAEKERDYRSIEMLLADYGKQRADVKEALESSFTALDELLIAHSRNVPAKSVYGITDSIKAAAKSNGETTPSAMSKIAGIANSRVSDADALALADVWLSDQAATLYKAVHDAGLPRQEVPEIYKKAIGDKTQISQERMFYALSGYSYDQAAKIWAAMDWKTDYDTAIRKYKAA